MDKQRRKQLQEEYSQIKTYMGVYQLENTVNGKRFIASTPNLKNRYLTLSNQLNTGRHPNGRLQQEWTQMGEGAFVYTVLEEKDAGGVTDVRFTVKQMEKAWHEKLQPYGDVGYHIKP